jgi:hypothetical protein
MSLGGTSSDDETLDATATVFETSNDQLVAFLKRYRWLESEYKYPGRPTDTNLQIEFLEGEKHEITGWLILAPQRKESFGDPLTVHDSPLRVKQRKRTDTGRFSVFGEPVHRAIADFLAGMEPGTPELTKPNAETKSLRNEHRGVLLLYPVREEEEGDVTIGFELFFPNNKAPFDLRFTVKRRSEQIVVEETR